MAGDILRSDLYDVRRLHTLKHQQELHIWAPVLKKWKTEPSRYLPKHAAFQFQTKYLELFLNTQ